jgi:amino acid transporter
LAAAWMVATQLGLKRVLALDVILYGLSLMLEFVAMAILRIREPELERPFRVPGGLTGAISLAIGPAILIGLAIFSQANIWKIEDLEEDMIAPAWGLILAAALAALGPVVYYAARPWRSPKSTTAFLSAPPSEKVVPKDGQEPNG